MSIGMSREEVSLAEDVQRLMPSRLFNLEGTVAVIAGAAGGIGERLAMGFLAAGSSVALVDIRGERVAKLAAMLSRAPTPGKCRPYEADLSTAQGCETVVHEVVEGFDCLDILVNCTTMNKREPTLDVTEDTFEEVISANLKAPFFMGKYAALQMIRQGRGGSIINIGSINREYGLPGVAVYGMAKGAMAQHTMVQARELAKHHIRANCIEPGFFDTPLTQPLQQDSRYEWILKHTPLGRLGHPDELLGAALLLASNAGSFMTGSIVSVHGGFPGSDWTG